MINVSCFRVGRAVVHALPVFAGLILTLAAGSPTQGGTLLIVRVALVVGTVAALLEGGLMKNDSSRKSRSAFIRGRVEASSISDVASDADNFVDGDVVSSRFERVSHSPRPDAEGEPDD